MYSKQKNINDFLEDNREKEIIHINSVQNDNQFLVGQDHSKISFVNQSISKKPQLLPKQQLKTILIRKRQTMANLIDLDIEERKTRMEMKKIHETSKMLQRSIQSKEDMFKTKQLIKRNKNYNKSLVERIKTREEKGKKQQNQLIQQQLNKLNVIREQRRIDALQKITMIMKRKSQRQEFKQKSNERQRQLRTRSYIFQRSNVTVAPKIGRNSSPNTNKELNMSEILQYEKNYKHATQQDRIDRIKKMRQFKKEFSKRSCKKYPQGKIASILKTQQNEAKLKEAERVLQPEKYKNRISEYGKIIKQFYVPPIKVKTQTDISKDKSILTRDSKSISELKQLGDSYLSYNKRHKSTKQNVATESPQPKQLRIVYKDYLKEIRSTLDLDTFYKKFNKILSQQNSPSKIIKLKNLVREQERKFPNPDENKLKQLTEAKLKIISYLI